MTALRRHVSVPAWGALLMATGLAGCSPGEEPVPTPEPTVVSSVPSPAGSPPSEATSTPASSLPEPSPSPSWNEEQSAAVDTVLEFFRLKNELGRDPYREFQPLAEITTGQTQTIQMSIIDEYRLENHIQTGKTVYFILGVDEVERADGESSVVVRACTDAGQVDVVDVRTQKSVLPSKRAFFIEWNMELLNNGYSWKVGDILSEAVDRCEP
ncbi:MAG: hypothetical protein ACTHU1_09230 [Arachnia sp.]